MKVALQNLPADLRALAYQIRIKHDGTYDSGGTIRKGLTAPTSPLEAAGCLHPAVIEHPVSGAHALYLGRRLNAYIEGMPLSESERILGRLWAGVEAATYRHCWQLGDLVMWDNRTTMHKRDAFDNSERRVMHRTQIKNSSPIRGAKPHEPMLNVR
jgi:taurine dioxygenase